MKKINLRSLLFYTLIPLMLSFTISMLIPDFKGVYSGYEKTIDLNPLVFIIVWSVLYVMMGISAYLIDNSENEESKGLIKLYYFQLLLNLLWPVVFFWAKLLLTSVVLIVILTILVIYLTIKAYKVNKVSAYLLIPYILWLMFATYLNIDVYLLNK